MIIVLLLTEAEHIAQKKVCENRIQDFLNQENVESSCKEDQTNPESD